MKKLLALVLCLGLVSGCGATATKHSVGVGSVTSFKNANASADKDGSVQVNTTFASVVLDGEGKIVEVDIDVAQNTGKVAVDGNVEVSDQTPTKSEKGDAYGMKPASPIGKEWFEQIEAFEAFLIGKNVDEVKAIETDDAGVPTSEDLTSSVTIKVKDYVAAVVKAIENAKEVEGAVKVGAGSVTAMSGKAASADAEGSVKAATDYAVVALDADNKVVYVDFDVAQNEGKVTVTGEVSATEDTRTKTEKGADYGMAGASPIGKEWFEQAEALEAYLVGKTVEEVAGFELNDKGAPAAEDLTSSVTVGVSSYLNAISKAIDNAVEIAK